MESIESIIRRYRAGDESAMGELLRRARSRISAWARYILRSRFDDLSPRIDADDVVQEVSLRVLRHFRDAADVVTEAELFRWATGMVDPLLLEWRRHHRRQKRDIRLEQPIGTRSGEFSKLGASREATGSDRHRESMRMQELFRILDEATPVERDVFFLVRMAGRTTEETTAELGIERRQVQSSLSRCHRMIARAVKRRPWEFPYLAEFMIAARAAATPAPSAAAMDPPEPPGPSAPPTAPSASSPHQVDDLHFPAGSATAPVEAGDELKASDDDAGARVGRAPPARNESDAEPRAGDDTD